MSTADQRSTDQRGADARGVDHRGADQRTSQHPSQHASQHPTPRQARHRAEVEILRELAHLPAWAAEVPDRGYYDAELRSPEWLRARRQGLVADLPEAPAERSADLAAQHAAPNAERGRAYPTSYRENFVVSV
jgi:hypothetical protein